MLVYVYSRINGRVKTRATLWSPQLTDEQIAAELGPVSGTAWIDLTRCSRMEQPHGAQVSSSTREV